MSLPILYFSDEKRELNFCNGYLSLLYVWLRYYRPNEVFFLVRPTLGSNKLQISIAKAFCSLALKLSNFNACFIMQRSFRSKFRKLMKLSSVARLRYLVLTPNLDNEWRSQAYLNNVSMIILIEWVTRRKLKYLFLGSTMTRYRDFFLSFHDIDVFRGVMNKSAVYLCFSE